MLFLLTHHSVLVELSKDWEVTKKPPQQPNTKILKKNHTNKNQNETKHTEIIETVLL